MNLGIEELLWRSRMVEPVVSSDETFHSELNAALAGDAALQFAQPIPRFTPSTGSAAMHRLQMTDNAATGNLSTEDGTPLRPWISEIQGASSLHPLRVRLEEASFDQEVLELEKQAKVMVDGLLLGLRREGQSCCLAASSGLLQTLKQMWALQKELTLKSEAQLQALEDARDEVQRRHQERDELAEEAAADALTGLRRNNTSEQQLTNSGPTALESEASKERLSRLLWQLRKLREETRALIKANAMPSRRSKCDCRRWWLMVCRNLQHKGYAHDLMDLTKLMEARAFSNGPCKELYVLPRNGTCHHNRIAWKSLW